MIRRAIVSALLLVATLSLDAAAGVGMITTVAGGSAQGDGGSATAAVIISPQAITLDATGAYYFVTGPRIRKVDAGGVIRAVAGDLASGDSGDGGLATAARLTSPTGVAVDSAGNVYIADTGNHRVRKVDTLGVITTVAGTGTSGFSGDGGPATAAALAGPSGVGFDDAGNLLIADTNNQRVRKVTGGTISTVAGNGTAGGAGDAGAATAAQLSGPRSVISDGAGGYYILENAGRIRRVNAGGTISRIAGNTAIGAPEGDGGPALDANIITTVAIARDSAGNLYLAQFMSNGIRVINAAGTISRLAGSSGSPGFGGDGGPALSAQFFSPFGVASDSAGNLWIGDSANNRIRKIDTARIVTTVAGIGSAPFLGDHGPAVSATLENPVGVAAHASGSFFIADSAMNRVRRVDASGTIVTWAGTGTGGPAALFAPSAVATDAAGNVFIADTGNGRIRKVDGAGVMTTFAGTISSFYNGDGILATNATLRDPSDVATDAAGNVYIVDSGNARVRKVNSAGFISTVAGNGSSTSSGDGGFAVNAGMQPRALALDAAGNLYIADGQRIRKVDPSGIITTIAGTGVGGFSGDGGPATAANLNLPSGLAVDGDGNVYLADILNHRVRVIGPDGRINTVVGNGLGGFSGDNGPAGSATLNSPDGLAIDSTGNLLIADRGNKRIRKVVLTDTTPDAFSFPPQGNVALSTLAQSASITPAGYSASAVIAVSGGEYSIGCTATFVSTPGTLAPGQAVCVRHTSSGQNNQDAVTTLSVGGRAGMFVSTTVAGPGSVSASPGTLAFGGQSMRTTSPAQTVTVTNTGATPVEVHAITASNQFAVTHDCGATLAPAASCGASVTFTPLLQGAVSGLLSVRASSGTRTVALAGTAERSLTTHYYRSILRRAPEPGGKEFWDAETVRMAGLGANVNEVWFAMATQFFFSAEYTALNRDNTGFVTDLYNTFFNRVPDANGLNFWTQALAGGMPREVVLASFMFSNEFAAFTAAIFGGIAARAEVDMVMDFYRGLLSRLPDSAGFNNWIQRFRTAQCAGSNAVRSEVEAISREFVTSTEYLNRNRTDAQYVGDLYNAFLRRGGDAASVQFWISKLADRSYTREIERGGFIQSLEFQLRVSRVIQQGCMP